MQRILPFLQQAQRFARMAQIGFRPPPSAAANAWCAPAGQPNAVSSRLTAALASAGEISSFRAAADRLPRSAVRTNTVKSSSLSNFHSFESVSAKHSFSKIQINDDTPIPTFWSYP
jgi:hypothetical protein